MWMIKGVFIVFLVPFVLSQDCDTDNGWEEEGDFCFRVSRSAPETQYSWMEAREACLAEGGDLASISSQNEQVHIISLALNVGLIGSDLWIGMYQPDGSSGTAFEWSDGSDQSYTFWGSNQPQTAGLTRCSYTATQDVPGDFELFDYTSTVYGLIYYPWEADGINTFYFGQGYSYTRDWCQAQCANNERCAAYSWFEYHWDYNWEFVCVGRSDLYNVLEYDSYGYSGVRETAGGGGWWFSVNCGLSKSFACKKAKGSDTPVTVPPTVPVDSYCPEGYFSADGGLQGKGTSNKCYRIVSIEVEQTGVRWEQALALCRNGPGINPDLATFNSPEENAMITAQLRKIGWGFWIGLHYAQREKTFVWADNSKIDWYNWGSGQPSGTDQCVELWTSPGPAGTWNNNLCSSQRGYICQTFKDPDSPIATAPTGTPNTCADGWTPFWYGCYLVDTELRTFDGAKTNCESLGGQLVSIHSEPENSAVALGMFGGGLTESAWIGLVKDVETSSYTWADGWPVSFFNFKANETHDGNCVNIDGEGYWRNTECEGTFASVCKQTDVPTPTIPTAEGYCPRGEWVKFGNRCYYFSTTTTTFTEAITQCAVQAGTGYSGTLLSVESYFENDFVSRRMQSSSAWIGFRRVPGTVDEFVWIDGTEWTYTRWAPGEPNDPINELCGEMFGSQWRGMWNDAACDFDYKYFICEATLGPSPTYPDVPTSAPNECPSIEWDKYEDQCFLIRPVDYRSWTEAKEICKLLTGGRSTLATIQSVETNQFLFQQAYIRIPPDQDYYSPHMWIGMSKVGYGYPYLWDDGSTVNYTNWAPGEPNDSDGTNNCVKMYVSDYYLGAPYLGKWDDYFCGGDYEYQGYVCQIAQGAYSESDFPEVGKKSQVYESRKQHWNDRRNRVPHQKGEKPVDVNRKPDDEIPDLFVEDGPQTGGADKFNQIIGIVVGSLIGVLAIAMIVAAVYINRKRKQELEPLTVDNPLQTDVTHI